MKFLIIGLILMGTALVVMNLAIEALKKVPDFDEKKLRELERARDALAFAITQEDSDLLLYSKNRVENLSSTYSDILKAA